MKIKVECGAAEFAALVRKCERVNNSNYGSSCSGCVFDELCQERGDAARIEHIISVELDEGGAADG